MKFTQSLLEGRLIRRYKRFLADVELTDGRNVTAHTANTGAMTGCCEPGSRVWLSISANPKRKYAYTWELVEANEAEIKTLVGINTLLANHLVAEAIANGAVAELEHFDSIRKEVRYGDENSRIDLLLNASGDEPNGSCYVEIKNVTLAQNGIGYFPDAKSVRASKHLRELMQMRSRGAQAVIFFCVPREDVVEVRPARFIDPDYADALKRAVENGVQALAYRAKVSAHEIVLQDPLPVRLDTSR
jgi:sugar fermentation stimulation protein A